MSRRRSPERIRQILCEAIEPRILFANGNILLDFGLGSGYTDHSNIAASYDTVLGKITTPAHQDTAVPVAEQRYNNVGSTLPTTIYSGNTTVASGVTLQWGSSSGPGNAITWASGVPSYMTTNSITGAASMAEFNNDLLTDTLRGTLTNGGEVALKITGLDAGTYRLYFVGQRPVSDTETYSSQDVQISSYQSNELSNVRFDAGRAQMSSAYYANGKFSNPNDYVTDAVTVTGTGDAVVVIVRGLRANHASSTTYANFNLLEIVKMDPRVVTSPTWRPPGYTQGFSNGSTSALAVSAADWQAYKSVGYADLTNTAPSGTVDRAGLVGSSAAGVPDGYLIAVNGQNANQKFALMTELTGAVAPDKIRFALGNETTNITVRVMIQSNGQWYASDETFSSAAFTDTGFRTAAPADVTKTFTFTTDAADWRNVWLDTVNGSLSLAGGTLGSSLSSGNITGIGFFVEQPTQNTRARMDSLSIVTRDGSFTQPYSADQAVAYGGWEAYMGSGATERTFTAPNPNDGADKIGITHTAGHPGLGQPNGGYGALYTRNANNASQTYATFQRLNTPVAVKDISWRMGNTSTAITVRVLVQAGGKWYASDQEFTTTATTYWGDFTNSTQAQVERRFNFTTDKAAWQEVSFTEGSTLTLVGAAEEDLPSNQIEAMGFYIAHNGVLNATTRIDHVSLTETLPQFVVSGAGETYGDWIGQQQVYSEGFLAFDSWGEIANLSYYRENWKQWKQDHPTGHLVLGVPMFIKTTPGAWSNALAGNYDSHFINMADKLIQDGLGDSYLRIGWEFNGDWYPWTTKGADATAAAAAAANYVAYWRRIVDLINTNFPQNEFKYVWNPNYGMNSSPNVMPDAALAYPGDNYVDFIGPDIYDTVGSIYNGTITSQMHESAATHQLFDSAGNQGNILGRDLAWYRDFAREHGKPLVIPEWGLNTIANSGLDNPVFIRMMHAFLSDPDNNVAWHGYFDTASHKLAPGGYGKYVTKYPLGKAEFIRLLGNDERAVETDSDIGSPTLAGSAVYNDTARHWTVTGSGDSLGDTSDQFHYAHNGASGDYTVVARVNALSDVDTTTAARAGIMMRDGTAVGAKYAAVLLTDGGQIAFHTRTADNGTPTIVTADSGVTAAWVKLVRTGNTITAFYAKTTAAGGQPVATDWVLIGSETVALATDYRVGMAVTSAVSSKRGIATFTAYSARPNAAPEGWTAQDIGSPGEKGSAQLNNTGFVLTAGGSNIGGTTDQFHYAYQTIDAADPADQILVARVDSFQNTNNSARTGVMFRQSTAANSAFVYLMIRPTGDLAFYSRTSAGATAATVASAVVSAPVSTNPLWLRLVKNGSVYTAFYNNDAGDYTAADNTTVPPKTWTQLGGQHTVTTSGTFLAGIAQSANDNAKLGLGNYGWTEVAVNPIGHNVGIKAQHHMMTSPLYGRVGNSGDWYRVRFDASSASGNMSQFNVVTISGSPGQVALRVDTDSGAGVSWRYLTINATNKEARASTTDANQAAAFTWVDLGGGNFGLWYAPDSAWLRWGGTGTTLSALDTNDLPSTDGAKTSIFTLQLDP